MSKQPSPAHTASATGPCPTIIQIVGRPGTGSFPRNHCTTRPPPLWSVYNVNLLCDCERQAPIRRALLSSDNSCSLSHIIDVGWLVVLGLTAL